MPSRKTGATDQRQVVHAYAFSTTTGALDSDTVTFPQSPPASLDDTIKKIGYHRDDFGRIDTVTSYIDTGSTKANEVAFEYGPWGAVTKSMQNHTTGTASGDPNVHYAYEDGIASNEAKYVRPDYVTYPGPSTRRAVYYNYPASGVGASWHGHLARELQGRPGPAVDGKAHGRDARGTCLRRGFGRQAHGQALGAPNGDAHGTHGRDAHATLAGRTKYASYMYLGAGTMVDANYPAVTGIPALTYGVRANSYSGFDRFGRVVNQKWQNQSGTPVAKDRFKYAYDPTSRLSRYARASRTSNRTSRDPAADSHTPPDANDNYYTYDGLDRLVKSNWGTLDGSGVITDQNADANQAWGLDTVGNWSQFKWDTDGGGGGTPITQTRAHNTANEIAGNGGNPISGTGAANWVDPTYDPAGNMTAGPQPRYETADANTQWYKYDAWNRLTRLGQGASSPGTLVVTYSYDGQNRRIRKVVAGGDTYDYYYNESWQVLEVRKGGSANSYEQYVWGVQYIDAPVVRFQDSDTNGTLNNTLYYTYDAQFNVTALIEPDGDVVERYVYDPYGQVTIYNGTWSSTRASSSFDNCIMYCGYWFDKESGNYIARRRYLTPPLGRWLTTDPIGYGDGMNRYGYVGSSPTTHKDPMGREMIQNNGWTVETEDVTPPPFVDAITDLRNSGADPRAPRDELGLPSDEDLASLDRWGVMEGVTQAIQSAEIDDGAMASRWDAWAAAAMIPWDPKHPGHMKDGFCNRCSMFDRCPVLYKKIFYKTVEILSHEAFDRANPNLTLHTTELADMQRYIDRCMKIAVLRGCFGRGRSPVPRPVFVPVPEPVRVPNYEPLPGMPKDLEDLKRRCLWIHGVPILIPVPTPVPVPVPVAP